MKRIDRSEKVNVHFHQAKWNEPIIYELSTPGERGVLVNSPEEEVAKEVKGVNALPEGMKPAKTDSSTLMPIRTSAVCQGRYALKLEIPVSA